MADKKLEQLDVDVRFLLANERTLLAWIRTSLTIEAGGIALAQVHKQHPYIGIVVLLLGACVAVLGYSRFHAADRAIREHRLPHAGHGPAIQVTAVVLVAVILAIAQLTILK
jgi:putative membrane protein